MSGEQLGARVRPQRMWLPLVGTAVGWFFGFAVQIGGAENYLISRISFCVACCLAIWWIFSAPQLRDLPTVGRRLCRGLAVLLVTVATWLSCIYLAPGQRSEAYGVDRILSGVENLFRKYAGTKQSVDANGKSLLPNTAPSPPSIAPDSLTMELAPMVLVKRLELMLAGEKLTSYHYGLAAILRVAHSGPDVHYIRQLEVTGNVPLLHSDYTLLMKEGVNIFEAGEVISARKPYRTLSWIAYPSGADTKIDVSGDEKFLRFLIVEPEDSVRSTMTSLGLKNKQHWDEYVGYQDTKTKPNALTRVPYTYDLVEPIASNANGQKSPWRLLPEVTSGSIRFQVRMNTGLVAINPADIRSAQWMFRDQWDKVTPQELFFFRERQLRGAPLGTDPLSR